MPFASDIAARLRRDLAATVGPLELTVDAAEDGVAVDLAGSHSWTRNGGDPSRAAVVAVEIVQQYVHDRFIDTAWPACPLHGTHPLWPHAHAGEAVWRCEASGDVICAVGELGA